MSDAETKPCPLCEAPSALLERGTASGSGYYDCPAHGRWLARSPAAELGSLGGKARANGQSAEEREGQARKAAEKRWFEEKLKKNVVP